MLGAFENFRDCLVNRCADRNRHHDGHHQGGISREQIAHAAEPREEGGQRREVDEGKFRTLVCAAG